MTPSYSPFPRLQPLSCGRCCRKRGPPELIHLVLATFAPQLLVFWIALPSFGFYIVASYLSKPPEQDLGRCGSFFRRVQLPATIRMPIVLERVQRQRNLWPYFYYADARIFHHMISL